MRPELYKYALTVVDVASRYKEAEPVTSKDSAEVAKAFQPIYGSGKDRSNLKAATNRSRLQTIENYEQFVPATKSPGKG